jgi:hypothetical protein
VPVKGGSFSQGGAAAKRSTNFLVVGRSAVDLYLGAALAPVLNQLGMQGALEQAQAMLVRFGWLPQHLHLAAFS